MFLPPPRHCTHITTFSPLHHSVLPSTPLPHSCFSSLLTLFCRTRRLTPSACRNFLRCLETRTDSLLDVVAINDSGGVKQASHLLKYDSTLGKFDAEVKIVDDSHISVNGKSIRVVSSRDPTKLPWGEMNVDLVIEGTGVFIDTPGASKHLEVGCRGCGVV